MRGQWSLISSLKAETQVMSYPTSFHCTLACRWDCCLIERLPFETLILFLSSSLFCLLVPPKIYDISSDITVNEGSNVSLICTATGKPEPIIAWRHITPLGEFIPPFMCTDGRMDGWKQKWEKGYMINKWLNERLRNCF